MAQIEITEFIALIAFASFVMFGWGFIAGCSFADRQWIRKSRNRSGSN